MSEIKDLNINEQLSLFKAVEALNMLSEDDTALTSIFNYKGEPMREPTDQELKSYEGHFDIDKFLESQRQKQRIRAITSMMYDFQTLRIATGNKVIASFNIQAGQKPGHSKEEMDKEMQNALKTLQKEYKLVTQAVSDNKSSLKKIIHGREIEHTGKNGKTEHYRLQYIKDTWDYDTISVFDDLDKLEAKMKRILDKNLVGIPIWEGFLKDVRGVGPAMAGVIIGYFDIYQAKYVSSFIKYTGIDTVWDDEAQKFIGRSKRKEHLEEVEYYDKDGNKKTKMSLTYNPFVKTKLIGVLPDVFIKLHSDYVVPYYDYYNRKKNDKECEGITGPHLNRMAKRYMIRQFLKDLFVAWKEIEGLPYKQSYEEEFLHRAPHHWDPFEEYKSAHPELFAKDE